MRAMIIPAAGSGSRLGTTSPKVIAKVKGRAMVDYLFDLYAPYVDVFILVVSPRAEEAVRRHCRQLPMSVEFIVQPVPTGMLDAILLPRRMVERKAPHHIWITWCDQIAVHPDTVKHLDEYSRDPTAFDLVFPTLEKAHPYTHVVRNDQGEIVEILHRREGDALPTVGESEMGLFSLSFAAYSRHLPAFSTTCRKGGETDERNFLPFIPWFRERGATLTFSATNDMETLGVNTPEDLKILEKYFEHA